MKKNAKTDENRGAKKRGLSGDLNYGCLFFSTALIITLHLLGTYAKPSSPDGPSYFNFENVVMGTCNVCGLHFSTPNTAFAVFVSKYTCCMMFKFESINGKIDRYTTNN